ncbi:MAG TPA: VOC family protein [Solirubrobacteraceae bacterium]|nr:VOC family protein [Solirubrobacteraceae bacterium]
MTETSPAVLPDTLRLGAVHLTVSDLDRSVAFYQDALGLRGQRRADPVAALGAGGEDLVVLHEEPGARPAGRHAGLFHFALLFPSREELARAVQRLAVSRTRLQGASDHGVSEAIYLSDPDGNGIELYADRPRDAWPPAPPGERVGMYTRALDLDDLLATIAGEQPVPRAGAGLRMGHVHLHVGDLDSARAFYVDTVGFEVMASMPSALFLAAGGYHHHLGANTWRGEGVGPAPAGTVGLREWTVVLDPDALAALAERLAAAGLGDGDVVADPWGIRLRLVRAPSS